MIIKKKIFVESSFELELISSVHNIANDQNLIHFVVQIKLHQPMNPSCHACRNKLSCPALVDILNHQWCGATEECNRLPVFEVISIGWKLIQFIITKIYTIFYWPLWRSAFQICSRIFWLIRAWKKKKNILNEMLLSL